MIKQLAGHIRQYKKETILTPVFMVLEVIMQVAIPMLMGMLIDLGIETGDMGYILKMGLILAVVAVLAMLFGTLSGTNAAKASAGFARNLRHDLYYHVQDFSFSNIDRFSTSSIVTRLTTDITNLQNAFQMIIRIAVRGPLMLIFSLFMAFSINPRVSLIFLGAVPVLGAVLYLITTHVHKIFERIFKTYDKLNNVVQENLRGIRVVKSFVREEHETGKFKTISQAIFKDFTKAEKILAFNMPLMQICMYTCMLLISWIGAKLIVSGSMTTGQLVSLFSYAQTILMSLMMLSMVFVTIIISKASAKRVTELLREVSDIKNGENPVHDVKDSSITFKNVNFSYANRKDRLCLSGINLSIQPGEIIGIIGGTGSSKTTLIQLIPRLYDATEGTVSVGGVEVRNYDLEALRNAVAIVLQKNVLFSGTIKDNLHWGKSDATDEEIIAACKLAQAHDFITSFPDQYDTIVEQDGTNLSGGQKQRLCIARALLKKPKILILDDSTSAVDTGTDAMMRQTFRKIIPRTTKLIIAQRISSISDADRIIIMEGGHIDAVGTHEELLKSNYIYREVYNSQMNGGDFDEAK